MDLQHLAPNIDEAVKPPLTHCLFVVAVEVEMEKLLPSLPISKGGNEAAGHRKLLCCIGALLATVVLCFVAVSGYGQV
jgi:hypothetical protein